MAVSKQELTYILTQSFPDAQIKIINLADDNDHYHLDITDKSFNDIPLIDQHKMVKKALKEVLKGKLHAISIKTIPHN